MRRTLAATALTFAAGALVVAQDAPNPFAPSETAGQQSPFESSEDQGPASPFDTVTPPAQPAAPAQPPAASASTEEPQSPFDTSDPYASTPSDAPFAQPPAAVATPAPAAPAPVAPAQPAASTASLPPNPFGSAPDPFSASDDPFQDSASPFGDSPFGEGGTSTRTPPSTTASGGSPFGAPGPNVVPGDNPFTDAPSAPGAVAGGNPFGGSAPAPADDPFGGGGADPFGAPADPFGGGATDDPFGGGATDDPFGGTAVAAPAPAPRPAAGTTPSADPFGGGAMPSPADDPFGGGAVAAAPADPFGGGAAAPADPFGGGAAAPADPFGGGATVAAGVPADPFGGGTAAPADPFGGGAAAPAVGGAAPTDPFGAPAAGGPDQPVVPVFDAAQGLANALGGDAPASPDAQNPDGISQLYAWRYERTRLWDGTPSVARRKLTAEEAKQYDDRVKKIYVDAAQAGTLPGYDPAADAETWAEWAVFADQLQLWSEYVDRVVLAGFVLEEGGAFDKVQWPGQPAGEGPAGATAAAPVVAGTGAEAVVAANQNQSLDDQAGGFFEFNLPGGGAEAGIPASAITNQVVTAYDAVLTRLREMESEQEDFMTQFESRLIERNTRRVAYADWKADREQVLDDFIREWNRRYSGKVSIINGVRYELYRPGETPEVFPRNTTPVVTDYELTPYDIINPDDGTLKQILRE